jgi:hypothetical protein
MIFIAHAGHWLLPILYASPLIVVVGLLTFAAVRDRRRERQEHSPPSGAPGADGV